MNSPPNYKWGQLLDINDFDLSLTPVLRPCNSYVCETTTTTITQNPDVDNLEENSVRIIPGLAGIVQVSAVEVVNANGGGIVNGCLGDIENYLKNGKLEQVFAIIKSCTPNALGDLTITLKDLSGIIHHKDIKEGGYGKDIIVGSALILSNILVFSPKPSMHYLNITMRNMVKVFHKDSVPDEEAFNLALKEEARAARAEQEWLEKCRKEQELDEEHERQL
ncbi:GPCR kinase [Tanacetum coccineum]